MSINQGYDVKQLKHNLEDWKYLLLPVNNLLEWEHKFSPLILVLIDTLIFGPSILTTVSILGLACLFFESVVPLITKYVLKKTEWDEISEAKYIRICQRIANFHQHIITLKVKLINTRKQKTSLYFFIVFFFLVFCAYVGQNVDNTLLTYITVVMLTLTPGARKHKVFQHAINKLRTSLGMSSLFKMNAA